MNRSELAEFSDSPRVDVLDLTQETASFYAIVFAALQHGLALVTYDGHFREIEGLRLITRPEDLLP